MPDGTPIIRDIAIQPHEDLAAPHQNQPPVIRDVAVEPRAHEDASPITAEAHADSGWIV